MAIRTTLRRLSRRLTGRRARALPPGFDAGLYLDLNADVALAIDAGTLGSAEQHYLSFGEREKREYRLSPPTADLGGGIANRWCFRYPFRGYDALPAMAFGASSSEPDDEALVMRLVAAWKCATADEEAERRAEPDGMWASHTRGFSAFHTALREGDVGVLAPMLAGLFQSHLSHGLAMGRSVAVRARHAPEPFSATWCDRLLRLAEALGLAPVRSPEQGDFTRPLAFLDLVDRIEAVLGFDLRFPDVGAPYGVRLSTGVFPEHAFSHAYAAWRIGQVAPAAPRVAEIGGGFGGLAWFMQRRDGPAPSLAYTILDLPFANVLQGYFLLKSGLDVSLYGEPQSDAPIRIWPWWQIDRPETYDLVINQDSIPEMTPATATAYVGRIRQIAPLFYSVNQEEAGPNTADYRQNVVPVLVEQDGGYRRLSRNLFWLRDGYVEEVYARR